MATAIAGKRSDVYWVNPSDLVIIGRDTKHKNGEHPLWDERAAAILDEKMIANIMVYGVISPIVCNRNGKDLEVIEGRQRTLCAREANARLAAEGKEELTVPITLKKGDSKNLFGIMVSSNAIRKSELLLDNAAKACRAIENFGKSREEAAIDFGVTTAAIANWLKINELHPQVKAAIREEKISAKTALLLADLKREDQTVQLAKILAPVLLNPVPAPADTSAMAVPDDDIDAEPMTVHAPLATDKPTKPPKKVSERVAKARLSTERDAAAAPTVRELRRIVTLWDKGEIGSADLEQSFYEAAKVIVGEMGVGRMRGLKAVLARLRSDK